MRIRHRPSALGAAPAALPPDSDGGDNHLNYHVRCVGATIADANGPSPQVVGGLVNGTPYTCEVSAINGAGERVN